MIEALIAPVTSLLDKFIPDADERARLAHEIATMSEKHAMEVARGQIEVNKTEAAHKSIFVAGWRPATGWCCSIALFWHFVLQPLATFVIAYAGVETPPLPAFDMDSLLTVLLGMLGLGGLRTAEKIKQVAREK